MPVLYCTVPVCKPLCIQNKPVLSQSLSLLHVNSWTIPLRASLYNSEYLEFKGTVSRDFLTLVFFIKHLLLVPLDTPRKDFKFFRIFEELIEFVIDSPVYSLPGSRDSPVYSSPGS